MQPLKKRLSKSTTEKLLKINQEISIEKAKTEISLPPEKDIYSPKTKMGRIFQQAKNQPFYDIEAAMLLDEVSYLSSDLELIKEKTTSINGKEAPEIGGTDG